MDGISFVMAGSPLTKDIVKSGSVIMLQIGKGEVIMRDHKRVDDALNMLREAKEYGRMVIAFDYDDDPRELFDIPEVCAYINRMADDHPDMFAFVIPAYESLYPLVLPIAGALIRSKSGGSAQVDIPDIDGTREKLNAMLNAANMTMVAGKQDFNAAHDLDKAMHSIGIL